MGLDIFAYRQLKPAPNAELDEDDVPVNDGFIRFGPGLEWSEEYWPGRAAPIVPGTYSYEGSMSFRAGSYTGYGFWRRTLKRLRPNDEAFEELIDFADSEGTLGTIVSAKLYRDFVEHREHVLAQLTDEERAAFVRLYEDFTEAFRMAEDGGAVEFC